MKKNISMLNGPLLKNIILYTIPLILTSLLQLLFNAADLIVVGQFCGEFSVAAVGATTSLTNLIINVFIGFSVGSGVSVAQTYGRGDNDDMHKTVHTVIMTAIVSGIVLTIIGVLFSTTFLELMQTPDAVLPLSSVYMRIYFSGMTFSMVYNFAAAILRAVGDNKTPLISLSIAGVINVILNVIFVTLLNMNVAGVALATITSQAISAFLVIRALMKRTDFCKLMLKKLRFYKKNLINILKIGLPAGLQFCLFDIANVIIQSSINSFGDLVVSAVSSSHSIEGFVYVCISSFSHAALNFTGQNIGANQHSRIPKILGQCLLCVFVVGVITGSLVFSFAEPLLSIYLPDSPEAISYGVTRLGFIVLTYFMCGLMEVVSGTMRGMGVSVTPMIITIICVCVFRIIWIYTVFQIPEYHSLECLFASYPISWTLCFIVELIVFPFVFHKIVKAKKS